MAESRDRRSTTGSKDNEEIPIIGERGTGKVDISDGRLRRTPDGGRNFNDYFSGEGRDKPVRRGELLGFLEMIEFSRVQSTWWRRFRRWLLREPGPADMPNGMATAYAKRSLKRAVDAVADELERRGEVLAEADRMTVKGGVK